MIGRIRVAALRRWSPILLLLSVAALSAACERETTLSLGKSEKIADGVQLYKLNDPGLIDPPGAIAIQILRIDPFSVDLRCALALDRPMNLETVPDIAARHHAIAAINAGFFVLKNGDPAGVLELDRELVSDAALTRGAVGIVRAPGKPLRLLFDRVGASVTLTYRQGTETVNVPVDGVDTTRARSKLMLYTPRFGPDSDTADTGIEWQLAGSPLRVTERRPNAGKTAIPRDGAVLSFGGTVLPTGLETLDRDQVVALDTRFETRLGTPVADWAAATDVVGGAGLLIRNGQMLTDWVDEQLRAGFNTERHPRTMIGSSRGGIIWLVTVDGRNPDVSVGMTFSELQKLATGLKLENALNLDGGGSTTMVAGGTVVNHPSDRTGPRKVSDALLVVARGRN
ncbi:MAG: phosphodiester glycosidase family protein [Acidobacteria bacterium]|nr:phosphodiester glycosidase family protein [Acidobacteriota bacterium]